MGTFNSSIQGKIEKLQKAVDTLLHMGENMDCICVDDLSLLNKEIHEQINDLYPCHGKTAEQEAALCLSEAFANDSEKPIAFTIENSVTHNLR